MARVMRPVPIPNVRHSPAVDLELQSPALRSLVTAFRIPDERHKTINPDPY
jgi:hypothetical protein